MPATTTPARNASLDALRVLSLFGIITLHVAGGGFQGMKPIGFVVDELSRFAVPVFFLLSAYFWKPEELAAPLRLTGKVAWRVLVPFVLWLAISIAWRAIDRGQLVLDLSPSGIALLVWSGGPAYHLWFLPALVVGTALVAVSGRYLGWVATPVLALFLFVLGTRLGAYARPLTGEGYPFWVDRNGLLFAPVFLVAGVLLRRHRDKVARLPVPAIAAALVLFAALQVAEGYFIVGRYPMGHDYSLATLGYGIAVAMLFMRLELHSPWWSILGRATFTGYLVHLLVLELVAEHLTRYSPAAIALTFIGSLAIGMAWQAVRARFSKPKPGRAAAERGSI